MELPFPLVHEQKTPEDEVMELNPKEKTDIPKKAKEYLFHTVDFAANGRDMKAGIVYFTSYKKRADVAQSFVDILPAYIEWKFQRDVVMKWFHPTCLGNCGNVEFICDSEGSWTGHWKTEEDQMNENLFNEDLGMEIHIEGLSMLESSDGKQLVTEDELSHHTFGTAFGRPKQSKTNVEYLAATDTGWSTLSDSAAAAPAGGGGQLL